MTQAVDFNGAAISLEESLIKTVLLYPDRYCEVAQWVDGAAFYSNTNRQIWQAISNTIAPVALSEDKPSGTSLLSLVMADLRASGDGEAASQSREIFLRAETAPLAVGATGQALVKFGLRRELHDVCITAIDDCFNLQCEFSDLLSDLITGASRIGQRANGRLNEWKVATGETIPDFEDYLTSVPDTRQMTGLIDLDHQLGGLAPGELSIWAARPGAGKSTFMMHLIDTLVNQGCPCLVFSLEMDALLLDFKRMAKATGINSLLFLDKKLTPEQRQIAIPAWRRIKGQPLIYDGNPNASIATIRASMAYCLERFGRLDVVAVDYLQLLSQDSANKNNEIDKITKDLRALGKEFGCHMLCLAQLNRATEHRADKRPMLSDIRDSGAIEQHADQITFIYRDEYYNSDTTERNTTELIVAKNRNGKVGTVKVLSNLETCQYRNMVRGLA